MSLANDSLLPEIGFVRLETVLKIIPVSKSGWHNGQNDGRYPRGVRVNSRLTLYPVSDIRALITRLENISQETTT